MKSGTFTRKPVIDSTGKVTIPELKIKFDPIAFSGPRNVEEYDTYSKVLNKAIMHENGKFLKDNLRDVLTVEIASRLLIDRVAITAESAIALNKWRTADKEIEASVNKYDADTIAKLRRDNDASLLKSQSRFTSRILRLVQQIKMQDLEDLDLGIDR